MVKAEVKKNFGVELELEVKIVGEEKQRIKKEAEAHD